MSEQEKVMDMNAAQTGIVSDHTDEMGTIAAHTKVTGNITTKGHLAVIGTVIGDITAKGNVMISGTVKGKITCANLMLEGCNVQSEINASECVMIKDGVVLNGKVSCKDITVMSNVNGDITASGKVGLSKGASVKGNITAAAIGVEVGAKIEGSLSIK